MRIENHLMLGSPLLRENQVKKDLSYFLCTNGGARPLTPREKVRLYTRLVIGSVVTSGPARARNMVSTVLKGG